MATPSGQEAFGFMIDDLAVARVARLSRLELSPQEVTHFRAQLGEILAYVQTLDALDLGGVAPAAPAQAAEGVLREDIVGPCLTHEAAVANAPAVSNGYFAVPAVISGE
jgi:aspartyl-tRNA(Asn)/glutamyl-tRNA(Gln) amidotransferase subunit C